MTTTVAIIGAGMGGLASAVNLSGRADLEITVFEAASEPGGKVGIASHSGVAFDTGPSLLTLPGIVRDLLAAKGCTVEEELDLFQPDPIARYHFPDGSGFDVAPELGQTEQTIREQLGPGAAEEFRDFMAYTQRIWEAAAPYFVMDKAPTVLTPFKMGLNAIRAFRHIDSTNTMHDAICRRVTDRRLRSVFLRYATFNGSDPRKAPATLNCITWVDLGLGGWGIRGGMYELADTLADVATRGGVDFHYDSPVRAIERRNDGFHLSLDRDNIQADAVIVNADIRHLIDDLWTGETPDKWRNRGVLSTSGFNLVLKAHRRPAPQRVAHEVVFPDRPYIDEFADLFDRGTLPSQPTIYLCAREKAHDAPGWSDHEPLFLMTNAPPHKGPDPLIDWTSYEAKLLEKLRRLDLIDSDDEIVWRRTPKQLAARFPGTQGSLYGAASNSAFSAFQRPANSAPGIDGLYLASGSAHPGGGVPLCIQSGRQATEELLEDLQR